MDSISSPSFFMKSSNSYSHLNVTFDRLSLGDIVVLNNDKLNTHFFNRLRH